MSDDCEPAGIKFWTNPSVCLRFRVLGLPKGQPRPRAFVRKSKDGSAVARVYDAGSAESWKTQIAVAARNKIPATPISGPVALEVEFFMPRPKGHFRTGKHAGQLKPAAPVHHTGKPDIDNAVKAVLDAMTLLGFWDDAKLVYRVVASKRYAGPGERPGAQIGVDTPTAAR